MSVTSMCCCQRLALQSHTTHTAASLANHHVGCNQLIRLQPRRNGCTIIFHSCNFMPAWQCSCSCIYTQALLRLRKLSTVWRWWCRQPEGLALLLLHALQVLQRGGCCSCSICCWLPHLQTQHKHTTVRYSTVRPAATSLATA